MRQVNVPGALARFLADAGILDKDKALDYLALAEAILYSLDHTSSHTQQNVSKPSQADPPQPSLE